MREPDYRAPLRFACGLYILAALIFAAGGAVVWAWFR
jgi:hypothetical protein